LRSNVWFRALFELESLSRALSEANDRWVAAESGDMGARRALREALEHVDPYEAAFSPAYSAMTDRRIFCSQCFAGFEGRRS